MLRLAAGDRLLIVACSTEDLLIVYTMSAVQGLSTWRLTSSDEGRPS
jgi:hypothetical protein